MMSADHDQRAKNEFGYTIEYVAVFVRAPFDEATSTNLKLPQQDTSPFLKVPNIFPV